MKPGDKPEKPRCVLGAILPNTIDVERVKADAWNNDRLLVISADDLRLKSFESHVIELIGERIYGR